MWQTLMVSWQSLAIALAVSVVAIAIIAVGVFGIDGIEKLLGKWFGSR